MQAHSCMRDGDHWVLVVEDDLDLRESVVALLEDEGFRAHGVSNGREALERLGQGPLPCLILLDLMMPEMNGDEFRRRQLAEPRLAHIPVVVVSAMHDVARAAEQLRATAHLGKPLNLDTLIGVVHTHC